jgi:hypothetical protein
MSVVILEVSHYRPVLFSLGLLSDKANSEIRMLCYVRLPLHLSWTVNPAEVEVGSVK